jgi:hypothetical protein
VCQPLVASVQQSYSRIVYASIVHMCWKPCIYWCSVTVRAVGVSIKFAVLPSSRCTPRSMTRGAAVRVIGSTATIGLEFARRVPYPERLHDMGDRVTS